TLDPATGAFAWTPGPGQAGEYVVKWTVSDGTLSASTSSVVRAALNPTLPSVTIDQTPSFPATPGQQVSIHVLPASLSPIVSRTLKVNGQLVQLDAQNGFKVPTTTPGRILLEATATDRDGFTGMTSGVVRVRDPQDTTAPNVHFDGALAGSPL